MPRAMNAATRNFTPKVYRSEGSQKSQVTSRRGTAGARSSIPWSNRSAARRQSGDSEFSRWFVSHSASASVPESGRSVDMPRFLISFDDGSMDHIAEGDMPEVGEAAHAVVREARA